MRGFFICTDKTMQRFLLSFAALSGFAAVALGAFAAHGLKQHLSIESLATFRTGVEYQMYHALALLVIALLFTQQQTRWLKVSGIAFVVGSVLFSGSLYALALGAPRILGIITPFGGLSFLIGWAALAIHAYRR